MDSNNRSTEEGRNIASKGTRAMRSGENESEGGLREGGLREGLREGQQGLREGLHEGGLREGLREGQQGLKEGLRGQQGQQRREFESDVTDAPAAARNTNPGNFANRPRDEVRELASKGGKASSGSFEAGSERAREAGRKGGLAQGSREQREQQRAQRDQDTLSE
jgi:general stress protein YciG